MTGKGCGIEKFTCHIIDEVPTDIEAAIVRLKHVFSIIEEVGILEKAGVKDINFARLQSSTMSPITFYENKEDQ